MKYLLNTPELHYGTFDILNSNMTPRLYGQSCKVSTTLLSRNPQKRLENKENQTKNRKITRRPRSHVRNFIYRTWAIGFYEDALETGSEFVPQNSPSLTEHRSNLEGNLKITVKTVICKLFFIQKCRVIAT